MSKTAFLGVGNMGSVIVRSALASAMLNPKDLILIDRGLDLANQIKSEYPGITISSSYESLSEVGLIFLAVKPQDFAELAKEIINYKNQETTFVSIMAGFSIASIEKALATKKIIKAAPNLANVIGKGVIGIYANPEVDHNQLELVQKIFNTQGLVVELENEDQVDKTTAFSGSGPAYVYYFIEAMEQAALELGFSAEQAKAMTIQTLDGALEYMQYKKEEAKELRAKVTSKGGTTQAGISVFEENSFNEIIKQAIQKAYLRAKELAA